MHRPLPRPSAPRATAPLVTLALLAALLPAAAGGQARPRPGTVGTPPRTPPAQPAGPTSRTPIARPPQPVDSLRRMPVTGIVWDSVASAPLTGATVQMASQANQTVSF